jgi:hypothetical protein
VAVGLPDLIQLSTEQREKQMEASVTPVGIGSVGEGARE